MRARGLKQPLRLMLLPLAIVAPHAGAWIETHQISGTWIPDLRRAPCGRVD